MILAREQINRYLRHIIMPEISGPGQKKLLESSVFICAENVGAMEPAVYYLAAAGIGSIYCQLVDSTGFDELAARIRDLNSDCLLQTAAGQPCDVQIVMGERTVDKSTSAVLSGFVPTIIYIYHGWRGGIQVFKDQGSLELFLNRLSGCQPVASPVRQQQGVGGEVFSTCFLGALAVMEAMKLILGVGEAAAHFLFIDLYTMEFTQIPPAMLADKIAELCSGPAAAWPADSLKDSKVLIVGTGGLGSPAAYALARAGVGTLGLVDYDTVEISNLNRQILHAESRLGMPKVESAAILLTEINPDIIINKYNTALTTDNIYSILADYDLVIAAVDNFPDRFLLNDACFFTHKPMLDAGVLRFDGTCMTIIAPEGHCYRCTLPAIPAAGSTPSCAESGVLGPLPGIMGFLQAAEAVKLLTGQGVTLQDRTVYLDGLFTHFCTIKLAKQDNCPLCGLQPSIHELQEYKFVCADSASTPGRE